VDNKALVRRLLTAVWERGELEQIDDYCAPDIVLDNQPGGLIRGIDAVKGFVASNRDSFPDLQFKVEEIAQDGDLVFVYSTLQGTQRGRFRGQEPTNRKAQVKGMSLWRVSEGKVRQGWGLLDVAGVMEQIGAFPAAES
jgi:predicted ester cyclase